MQPERVSPWKILLFPMLLGLAACGGQEESPTGGGGDEMASIDGEVFYRERMMLPPGAEVEVQLQDVSRADALATVMASVMFTPEGGPPYPFSIDYRPAEIDERMRYSLRATITLDGQLMFTSTEYIDPFSTEGISIMVQRVPEPVAKSPMTPQPEVDEAEQVEQAGGSQQPAASASDDEQAWILETLGGERAPLGAGGNAIDLVLNAADNSAHGFSGCNRYTGSFSNEGKSTHGTPLKFGPMAATMMACAEGDAAERAYLQMLGSVDAYRMQGSTLALLRGEEVLATFKLR